MENTPAPMDATWLVKLEERVERAVAEIGRLRQDNRRLERELARLKKAGAAAADGSAAWERERTEVKGRVERLAKKLEELLGEGAGALLEASAPAATASATATAELDEATDEEAEEPDDDAPGPLVQRTLEPVE